MEEKGKEFKHLVRIANTDLDGNKSLITALRKIKGINFQFANMVCVFANLEKGQKTGYLGEEQINKLDDIIRNPVKYGAPSWMLNRRRDYETNETSHLILSDLDLAKDNDLKRMKKIKCYRGVRHIMGLPCRGQRTKSNFRKTKSKGGPKLGVIKKKVKSGKV